MTDDELIEAMAREAFNNYARPPRVQHTWVEARAEVQDIYRDMARAALVVAKKKLVERCAKEAETEWWEADAHPDSIHGAICRKIAARIRRLGDE